MAADGHTLCFHCFFILVFSGMLAWKHARRQHSWVDQLLFWSAVVGLTAFSLFLAV